MSNNFEFNCWSRACSWMATEIVEVSNRVNLGSKPRHLACPKNPDNVQIRWYRGLWNSVSGKMALVSTWWKTWQLGFQWHWIGIKPVSKSLDCFTGRLFHSATIFFACYVHLFFETSPGWLLGWRVVFLGGGVGVGVGVGAFLDRWVGGWGGGGRLRSNVYWYLGRQVYLGVSNVALVIISDPLGPFS